MRVIVTGTQAYGPVREDSDIDIVVSSEEALDIWHEADIKGIKVYQTPAQESYDTPSFYFDIGALKINIIAAGEDPNWDSWARATVALTKLDLMPDRAERIACFQDIFRREME